MNVEIIQLIVTVSLLIGIILKWYTKYSADLTQRGHNAAIIIVAITSLATANSLSAIIVGNIDSYGSMTALVIACVLIGWGAADGAFNLAGGNAASQGTTATNASTIPVIDGAAALSQPAQTQQTASA